MRESDGTPDEPRDQTGERDSSVAAVEPEELDRIFHEEIVPGLLSEAASVHPSEKPELVVVGGQMGAGKSTMIAEIKDSFADRGSVLHLSGDDFFRFHPRYAELMAQRDPDAIRHLVRDSGRWFRMAREHAIANRQHVILELAMGDPAKEAGIMREFADNGYTARAEVMAVAEPQSRLSTIGRYLDERIDHGVHRYTPPRLHEASFTGSQEMVGHLESADPPVRVEALTVRSRSGVLFENRRGPDGQWAHVPRAAEEMAHERDRPWTADEKRRYQEQLADVRRRIAQLAELRPEESATLTMLGQELRETEARALPWLDSDAHDEATTSHHDDDTGPPLDSAAPVTAEAEARYDQAHDAQHDIQAQTAGQHEYLRTAEERDLAEAPPEQHDQIRASYARAHELVDLATASDKASLRILAVIDEWHPSKGGVVSVNKNLCEALADLGHEVFVRVGHEVTGLEGADKVTLIAPREPDSSVELRHQLTSNMADLPTGIDAVIGHSRFSGPAAREIRDGMYPQARLVHIVHMVTDSLARVQGKPERVEVNHGLEADLVSTTDVAVGVGPALAEEAARLASMTGTSPVVHQMIPGIEFFDQVRPPADRETKRMLVFGRADDPVKGAMQAAEMVKKLNEQGIDVDLIVRGVPVDQMRAQLRSLREAAGRDVDVRPYTLERDEILADMRDANVVLMPSRAEGFGLVATEAAGAGVPIVVPSTSGAGRFFGDPDLFPSDLTAGMLVEQGYEDPVPVDRWVDALAHQLSDQDAAWDRALDLQQTLRDRQYTWESAGAALMDATATVPPREQPAAGMGSDRREPST
ncbi:zeta toxin family protein [Nocardia coffeae]|uniref:zeta toxin family protein n=1 Tax=Nocardia coffeae TaxID=2873381 RepID=UPI0027DFCBAA|nr:zeta toxin family protein [Nocardia coffeae]